MLFQVDGKPMYSVKFEDLLKIVGSNTAVLKMDIEGYECKVGQCFHGLMWVRATAVMWVNASIACHGGGSGPHVLMGQCTYSGGSRNKCNVGKAESGWVTASK
jgi:hypothetical protein